MSTNGERMAERDETGNGKPTLGFLTAVEHPEHGLFGGYLVVTMVGRPIEFHCTLPIKPNRAQEILYGPTLDEFLHGEQIGQALLRESRRQPLVVLTNRRAMLAAREFTDAPLALVLDPLGAPAAPPNDPPGVVGFELGGRRLGVAAPHAADRALVVERLAGLGDGFDLAEPFERIAAAIEEAQKAAC